LAKELAFSLACLIASSLTSALIFSKSSIVKLGPETLLTPN